jgi:hypothetical protein
MFKNIVCFLPLMISLCFYSCSSFEPDPNEVVQPIDSSPAYHPSGRFISYIRTYNYTPTPEPDGLWFLSIGDLSRRSVYGSLQDITLWFPTRVLWHPNGDKFFIDYDNSGLIQLIDTTTLLPVFEVTLEGDPIIAGISPDGHSICYFRYSPPQCYLYRWETDSSTLMGNFAGGSFSPTGNELVVLRNYNDVDSNTICIIDTQGTIIRELTPPPGKISAFPKWSPDGGTILFCMVIDDEPSGIWSVDTSGSNSQKLTSVDAYEYPDPVWSNTGGQIVYIQSLGDCSPSVLFRINKDGTGKVQLTSFD